jgi:hypothetical protein
MKNSLLVLDGSRAAAYSVGCYGEGATTLGDALRMEVELADTLADAEGALEESSKRPFLALLTEPCMFERQREKLPKYLDFLEAVRGNKLPVVVWSAITEQEVNADYGLIRGKHYDAYSPRSRVSGNASQAELLQKNVESLLHP